MTSLYFRGGILPLFVLNTLQSTSISAQFFRYRLLPVVKYGLKLFFVGGNYAKSFGPFLTFLLIFIVFLLQETLLCFAPLDDQPLQFNSFSCSFCSRLRLFKDRYFWLSPEVPELSKSSICTSSSTLFDNLLFLLFSLKVTILDLFCGIKKLGDSLKMEE